MLTCTNVDLSWATYERNPDRVSRRLQAANRYGATTTRADIIYMIE